MENKIKYDCFGFKEGINLQSSDLKFTGCKILKEMLCIERECPFYKTWEEYKKGFENMTFCGKAPNLESLESE